MSDIPREQKIIEAATDLIEWIDQLGDVSAIYETKAYNNLKASLKPSRQEVAEWMKGCFSGGSDKDQLMFQHAIDYLNED